MRLLLQHCTLTNLHTDLLWAGLSWRSISMDGVLRPPPALWVENVSCFHPLQEGIYLCFFCFCSLFFHSTNNPDSIRSNKQFISFLLTLFYSILPTFIYYCTVYPNSIHSKSNSYPIWLLLATPFYSVPFSLIHPSSIHHPSTFGRNLSLFFPISLILSTLPLTQIPSAPTSNLSLLFFSVLLNSTPFHLVQIIHLQSARIRN